RKVGLAKMLALVEHVPFTSTDPWIGQAAGLEQNPIDDRHDQSGILGQRDELARADEAVLVAVPAQQRFEADQPFARSVDHRLEVELELLLADRVSRRMLQLALLLGARMKSRLVTAVLS